jgi:hypothetical protein
MEDAVEEIWRAGFDAGQRMLSSRSPFPFHSPQADAWEDGWTQGMLKREGLPYRGHPPGLTGRDPRPARQRLWRSWRLRHQTSRQR